MAMTDEQIKALRDRAATLGWLDVALKPDMIRELCDRVLDAEAENKRLLEKIDRLENDIESYARAND